jgi:microcystin-dependent protein
VSSGPSSGDSGGTAFKVTPGEATQVALTPEEQQLVTKLLGDPTYFPIEFRRWLEDFLGNSDFKISQSQIMGGGAGGGSSNPSLLPAGIILPYATTTIGKDCLLCNGATISRTDYKELFDAIGTAWGSGDGSTTFKVPDLRDRALYGIGSVVSLGGTDGKSTGNRGGPNHHHDLSGNTSPGGQHGHSASTDQAPNHGHTYDALKNSSQIQQGTQGGFVGVGDNTVGTYGTNGSGAHSHAVSVQQAPNHQHSFSGSTTGGYGVDQPSWAGIQYAITTGRSATT